MGSVMWVMLSEVSLTALPVFQDRMKFHPVPQKGWNSGIKKAGIQQEMPRLVPGAPVFLSGG